MLSIPKLKLEGSYSFEAYLDWIQQILDDAKLMAESYPANQASQITENQKIITDVLVNLQLNKRLYNTFNDIQDSYTWVVIAEPWCIDVAYSLPVLYGISQSAPNIDFKIIPRDNSTNLIEEFLTNGKRSIPKLLILSSESKKVLDLWGPRPQPLQQKVFSYYESENYDLRSLIELLSNWYVNDRSISLQQEILNSLKNWYK